MKWEIPNDDEKVNVMRSSTTTKTMNRLIHCEKYHIICFDAKQQNRFKHLNGNVNINGMKKLTFVLCLSEIISLVVGALSIDLLTLHISNVYLISLELRDFFVRSR